MTASTIFRRVQVFDGHEVSEADSVLVSDGVITAVGRDLAAPPDAAVLDGGGGRTLLPGLIDAHTHMVGPSLARAIVFGVTTELDMASMPSVVRAAKEHQAGPETGDQADVLSAGHGAGARGGHGSEFFAGNPKLDDPEEAEPFVAARITEGSDYIKIHYKDGQRAARLAGRSEMPVLSQQTMAAVAAAAARHGRLSLVHIGTQEGAVEAIEAGVSGLAHIFVDSYPDPAFAPLLAARGGFLIPTLVIAEGVGGGGELPALAADERLAPYLDGADRGLLRMVAEGGIPRLPVNLEGALEAVAAAAAAGVPVLAGSDMSQALHGAALHRELELLVRAGRTARQALSSATAIPASVFGLRDRGRIAPGLRADLVLVEGDPVTDITATRAIAGVWKRGVEVRRDYPAAPLGSAARASGGAR
jgi:imidazolonepropionase-like amidohydrolase